MKLLTAFFMLAALTGSTQANGIQRKVHVDCEFGLKSGTEVLVKEAGMNLRFVDMVEDSRCPEGVDCIWAGNGKITLTVKQGKHKSVSFELNTNTEPLSFIYQGYAITLVKLAPYPKDGVAVKKAEYVATLKVTRKKA